MRIIIAGPVFADSFAHNVAFTLKQMGHEVSAMPATTPHRYASVISRSARLINGKVPFLFAGAKNWLLREVRTFRPTLLIALTETINEEILREVRGYGVRYCVAWWGDALGRMQEMGLLSDEWDFIFLKESEGVAKLRRVGLNAFLLHEAMNPSWHRPVAAQKNETVTIVGTFYGYREYLTLQLMNRGVSLDLYGGPLPVWSDRRVRQQHKRLYVTCEDKSRVFGEALACVNSTDLVERNSLNARAFEIAGAGGLQLFEWKPVVEECFEPGQELLTYSSVDELCALVDKVRRDPRSARAIREAAARRAKAHHTYEHRLREILSHVQ